MISLAENSESINNSSDHSGKGVLCLARGAALFGVVPLFLLHHALGKKRYRLSRNAHWSKTLLKILNIRVSLRGSFPSVPFILVSNHSSWLDPIVLNSVHPAYFLTSLDVAQSAFLGRITKSAGCLFCSRKPWTIHQEIQELGTIVREGHSLGFFPEATSNDGKRILPFRSAFFTIAQSLNTPVVPVVIHWSDDRVHYYGDHQFFPHLLNIIKIPELQCTLSVLDPISPQNLDRKDLAKQCETLIRREWEVMRRA